MCPHLYWIFYAVRMVHLMEILQVTCYHHRAHLQDYGLKRPGQEEIAESLQNWLIYPRVLHVKPGKYACWETRKWGRGAFHVGRDMLLTGTCWHKNWGKQKTSLEPLPSPQSSLGSHSGGHWAIWGHWSNHLSYLSKSARLQSNSQTV